MKKRRQRDPERTRAKLLAAATIEFSDKGLKGARISGIARRAGTNYQAIYHHFGSKEKLYSAVLEALYVDDWFEHAYPEMRVRDPVSAVTYLLDVLLDRFQKDTHYSRLFSDENLHQGRHLKNLHAPEHFFRRVIEALTEVLERGAREGVFRADVDPRLVYMMVSSEIGIYFSSAATRSALFGRDMASPEETRRWIDHFKTFVIRGLRAD